MAARDRSAPLPGRGGGAIVHRPTEQDNDGVRDATPHLVARCTGRLRPVRQPLLSAEGRQALRPGRRPLQPRAPLGDLRGRARGLEGAVGVARLAAPHGERGAGGASAVRLGKTASAQSHRHALRLSSARIGAARRAPSARDRRLRAVDAGIGRPDRGEPLGDARSRTMKGNVLETVMGAVVLVVAALFLFFAYNTSQLRSVKGYELFANFEHIDGIRDGSDVRVSGIKIGSVLGLTLDPKTFLATVRMSVEPSVKLPDDSVAEIVSSSLLGDKYLSLVPGGSDKDIAPGGRVKFTQSSISLEHLIGQMMSSPPAKKPGEGGGASPGEGTPSAGE